MKVLFDECIPAPLLAYLVEDEAATAQMVGWGRLRNGDLLRKAEGVFDAFVTADQNLKYQQNLTSRKLAIIQLPTNHWPTLERHAKWIAAQIKALKPGDYIELDLQDSWCA